MTFRNNSLTADIIITKGNNNYQSLGTNNIVNPPSNSLSVGGVNVGALNKRTRTSYATAKTAVTNVISRSCPSGAWCNICWSSELGIFCVVGEGNSEYQI